MHFNSYFSCTVYIPVIKTFCVSFPQLISVLFGAVIILILKISIDLFLYHTHKTSYWFDYLKITLYSVAIKLILDSINAVVHR